MNEIRKNNEKEQTLLVINFKMPKLIIFLYIVSIICFLLAGVVPGIILLIIFIAHCNKVRNYYCRITNKKIEGRTGFLGGKNFSYRLDMIDSVETSEVLGNKSLRLNFSKGKQQQMVVVVNNGFNNNYQNGNFFNISWVDNIYQAYSVLSKLLANIKNDKDVKVDIEMKKIKAEENKADAFVKIAESLLANKTESSPSNKTESKGEEDYIRQVERLFELKEKGIITEEEYNEKKKKLL